MHNDPIIGCPEISVAQMLPFGFALRPLLNDSCLTDGDLNNLLKSRGVFLGNTDKKSTIPLIVTMVLSPKEFEALQERQETKESNPKHRNSTIQSKSVNPLITAITGFNIAMDKVEEMNDIELITPMTFATLSENHLQLEYDIIRKDLTKDWVRPESRHSGKVDIKKDDLSNKVEICNEYTSKETDDINKQVIKDLIFFLKEKKEVDDKIETVTAADFTNRERFNFLLQLAADSDDGSMNFVEIKDIELGPDPKNPPKNPDSIIQQNVKKVIINGNALEGNTLLTNDGDKDHLIFRSLEAKYEFNHKGTKGFCILQYGFMHFFRNQNTSQEFQVALLYLKSKSGNKVVLNNFVLEQFEHMKKKALQKYKVDNH
jgi:hypothetical protein